MRGTSAAPATPEADMDSALPPEVDLSRGRRGTRLPADPAARAKVLEQRVILLQRYGARLRTAAEQVYQSAIRSDQRTVDATSLEMLRRALYEME